MFGILLLNLLGGCFHNLKLNLVCWFLYATYLYFSLRLPCSFYITRSLCLLPTGETRWSLGSVSLSLPVWNLVSENLYKDLFWLKETLTYLHLASSWLGHPQCLLFFQVQATPVLKYSHTVLPSDPACLHPTSITSWKHTNWRALCASPTPCWCFFGEPHLHWSTEDMWAVMSHCNVQSTS